MNLKSRNISSLIENQVPSFINEEYELFVKFLKSYYAQQELSGGVLDIILNLTKYRDINFYSKEILTQSCKTTAATGISDTSISVDSTQGFPDQGMIKIGNEILFYKEKTETEFSGVSRGVSGNTSLGDLYQVSNYTSSEASTHVSDSVVLNISNLFLYALIQSFESEYLAGIPEKYLRGEIDKRTLIKNIASFYKAKGTKRSIQFIFNSLVSSDPSDVYFPKNNTLKASESDWINVYAIRVVALSGNPENLIGERIVQSGENYASAVVENVIKEQVVDGVQMWDLILSESSVNNVFTISNKTFLTKSILATDTVGDSIRVDSTYGWDNEGSFYVNGEVIEYSSKTINKFVIKSRKLSTTHSTSSKIYSNIAITGNGVSLLPLGVTYTLTPKEKVPYGVEGEEIVVEDSGFDTIDRIIKTSSNAIRWKFPSPTDTVSSGDTRTQTLNSGTVPGISQIFRDSSNYYVCSSGFPLNRTVFFNQTIPAGEAPIDQPLLRTIRKQPIVTTEIYKTPRKDAGIFIDGVLIYTHKHEDSVFSGGITSIDVTTQGSGYVRPPFVLVDNQPYKATAVLSGNVVESISVNDPGSYTTTPQIDIVSGRNAILTPVVTNGRITSVVITNPGEYYSAPPTIRITDRLGRGRFAEYTAVVSATGAITEVVPVNQGNFYTSGEVLLEVIPAGSGAEATASIFEWIKNRYVSISSSKDTEHGFSFENSRGFYNYGAVAYPPSLKTSLGDTGSSHSPIIGFAYDGNPIYGPYGYSDAVDPNSAVSRLGSGYRLRTTRTNGPSVTTYPLGSFIQDYYYADRLGDLDRNNGRFCVTPEYPEGVYAYFVTEDVSGTPQYPYIIGENFYSLPLSANYEEFQTHNDLPKDAVRLRTQSTPQNGLKTRAKVKDVSTGSIDTFQTYQSSNNFSVGARIILDDTNTGGSEASGTVASVNGKQVNSVQATDVQRVATIQITENCYIYDGDIITQQTTGVTGRVVGDVLDSKFVVLENVSGTFDATGLVDSSTLTLNIVLNTNATFTSGAIVTLTDGNNDVATGEVVESTERRNSVKLKVLTGTFNQFIGSGYYLRSNNLLNTVGAEMLSTRSLSTDLVPFIVDTNVALVTTADPHGLGIGSRIDVRIDPDDSITTKDYFVQLGAVQEIKLQQPNFSTTIDDAGLGRVDLVNGGVDYASATYNDIELIFADQSLAREDLGRVGDANNAEATIVVSDINNTGLGSATSVTITTKGSGYRRGDVLTVEDASLNRSQASNSTQRLRLIVDHIGFASGETVLKLVDVSELSTNDLLEIGSEIVKITSVSETNKTVNILRGQEATEDLDHYDGETVSLYNTKFTFNPGSTLSITGNASLDPVILSYSGDTLIIEHNQSFFNSGNIDDYKVGLGSSFFDESNPKRLVTLSSVSDYKIVTKISDSLSGTYSISPNLKFQEYYQYRFNLSHFTNAYSEFIISPSKLDNIIAPELVRVGTPGQANSYVYAKFGYGARTGSISLTGTLTDRKQRLYQRYYYKSIVTTDSSGTQSIRIGPTNVIEDNDNFIEIISDPLQNQQTLVYVTNTRFVYSMGSGDKPEWYGTGNISYTTTAPTAVGSISSVDVLNLGSGYKKIPLVVGGTLKPEYEATVTANWDPVTMSIDSVTVNTAGSNYSKPKIVITDGDGKEASFEVLKTFDNKISGVVVINKGKNYTYKPSLRIIEGDVRVYALGSNIGITKNIEMEFNGSGIWNDTSILRRHSSSVALILDTNDVFLQGETINQGSSYGVVSLDGWRTGSNVLKVSVLSGEFVAGQNITSVTSNSSASVLSVLNTEFDVDLRSYYDNLGRYQSDKGKVGVRTHKIADNKFYQDYSYVIESTVGIEDWRDLINDSVHPAGFKLFGELNVDSQTSVRISDQSKSSQVSTLKLWDKNTNKVSIDTNNCRTVSQTTINLQEDLNKLRGSGSLSPKAFDDSGLIAREIYLSPSFDGDFDSYGNISGTRIFTIYDKKTNQPISPYNAMSLTITLDGILQEPETSYTVSGDQITFATAPIGPRVDNNASIPAQKFVGRLFEFKDATKNSTYLKKIKPIYQQGGTWIDAANQVRFNKSFIVEEAIGYAKETYSSFAWNQLETSFSRNLSAIVDSIEHDLRFGGNYAVLQTIDDYTQNGALSAYPTESSDIFQYVTSLVVAAMRNWDISLDNCTVTFGSDLITVPSTLGLCIGMNISSGAQFDPGTTLTEIISPTEVRVSRAANTNYNPQNITTSTTTTGSTNYGTTTISPGGILTVGVGSTLTIFSSINNINQVTFSFSRINNGTYIDAANLIAANREYIAEETIGWVKATYPNLQIPDETKCRRDTGYLVDAFEYHLRYGGNQNVIDFGERYYEGNRLSHINNELTESIAAYRHATSLMVLAMRNNLPAGTYTTIIPYIDPAVLPDPKGAYQATCADVEQTLNTYMDIVDKVLSDGPNLFEVSPDNNQRSGNWTTTQTYSNINILNDPNGFLNECSDVQSALNSLYLNMDSRLNSSSVTESLPDYFDGENVEFELYYTDNTPVKTNKNEDLFVAINGVFQKAKYDENLPRNNSYYIKRSSVSTDPDKIVFVEPPKWEQDLNTLLVQEPIAVEKFFAHNVGKYQRLVVREENFNGSVLGPFIMRDEETSEVVIVDDDRFLLVFLDGVLQERGRSYTINESSITFKGSPISGQKLDLILLSGDATDQILSAFNVEPDLFFNQVTVSVTGGSSEYASFVNAYKDNVIVYQAISGEYKTLGMIKNHNTTTGGWEFTLISQNPEFDFTQPIRISTGTDIVNSPYTSIDLSSLTTSISYVVDSDQNHILRKDVTSWLYAHDKPNITKLESGDLIKIDGEDEFRRVKSVPNTLKALDYAPNTRISSTVGSVSVSNYNGITRGEGLDIKAVITNGVVTSLDWNRRDLQKNPDAYQYNTPPIIVFESVDQNGGGAMGQVIVDNGEVIDVLLTHGGSGYTSAPIVNVSRGYEVIKKTRQFDTKVTLGLNNREDVGVVTSASSIGVAGGLNIESTQLVTASDASAVEYIFERQQILDQAIALPLPTSISRKQPVSSSAIPMGSSVSQVNAQTVEQIQTTIQPSANIATFKRLSGTAGYAPIGIFTATYSAVLLGVALDIDYDPLDPHVFASTANFPAQGVIQVGLYQLEYSSILSDRFVIDYGSVLTTQPAAGGTVSAGDVIRQVV